MNKRYCMDKNQNIIVEKEQDKKFENSLSSYKKFYKTWMPIFFILILVTNVINLLILLLGKYIKQLPLAVRITFLCVQGIVVTILLIASIMMIVKLVQFRKTVKERKTQNNKEENL